MKRSLETDADVDLIPRARAAETTGARGDGHGITAEAAARATEPFFTTKPRDQGTGLGLAIANEIVKMHRGTLSLRPASPRGTWASMIVPIPKVEVHHAA